jgi:PST family polysaccharide transporter
MSLIKTSLLNGIAVAAKIATGLILNKVVAVYVGPTGYAIIGQFQNALATVTALGGGMITTGVTKSTAENFEDANKQHDVWKTAISLGLCASLMVGVILVLARNHLVLLLFHTPHMSSIFIWIALTLPAIVVNNILLAILNGKKEVLIYVAANIFSSFLSLLVTGFLAYNYKLYGVLVALTVNPAIALFSTATLIKRREWFKFHSLLGHIKRPALKELTGFGLMGLTAAISVPVSHLLIRGHITTKLGLTAAGYWQASWKISEIYLMIVTSTLAVYYLPRLAEIRLASELMTEIKKVYRTVLPLVVFGSIIMFVLRDLIIEILFTRAFFPMRELFPWQLTGDVIKISGWILSYVMLGRAMVKPFITTEILFSISFVALSWLFINYYGLVGVPMAYATNYVAYWLSMVYLVKSELKKMVARPSTPERPDLRQEPERPIGETP